MGEFLGCFRGCFTMPTGDVTVPRADIHFIFDEYDGGICTLPQVLNAARPFRPADARNDGRNGVNGLKEMVHPARFERATSAFGGRSGCRTMRGSAP
jgi:hypothetical protein